MSSSVSAPPRICRILYYGPGGAGKRENLSHVRSSLPPDLRLNVATEDEQRQMAFLLRNGDQGEWQVLLQAIDAGRERYHSAGSQQIPPFDGIVFVVNSETSRLDQSLSSLEALKTYLDTWGRDLMSVPMVLQYNRRASGDVLPVDRLESLINPWGLLSFPADSNQGEGVKETLKAILGLTISHLLECDAANPAAPAETPQQTTHGFDLTPPVPGTLHTPEYQGGTQAPPNHPQAPIPPAGAAPQQYAVDVQPVSGLTQARHYNPGVPAGPGQQGAPGPAQPVGPGSQPAAGPQANLNFQDANQLNFYDSRPPIVIPVRVPRSLLENHATVRIMLEIVVDDNDGVLS